jgi:hypothetical protein
VRSLLTGKGRCPIPLKPGHAKKTIRGNIKELLHSYKHKGTIGNTTPKSMAHARRIAAAIAYGRSKASLGGYLDGNSC